MEELSEYRHSVDVAISYMPKLVHIAEATVLDVIRDYVHELPSEMVSCTWDFNFSDVPLRRIVNSKAVVTATALDPFRVYLSCIPEEDWRAVVEPALVKLIKKAPESASAMVSAITGMVGGGVDLGNMIRDTLTVTAIRILKSSDDAVRANGHDLVVNVCRRCRDPAL
eukprot:gene35716-46333_t